MTDNRKLDQRARDVIGFIPMNALQDAVAATGKAPSGLATMGGMQLRKHVLAHRTLTAAQIVELWEQWRYGSRVALTLAIFEDRPKKPATGFLSDVGQELERALVEREATDTERELAIVLIGDDRFDEDQIIELSFRYGHHHEYLDLEERSRSVIESRFGFAWICARDQFIAVSGEERVVAEMIGAVTAVLGKGAVRVAFGKATMDANFKMETISSILHLDLFTGTRRRVSREGLKGDPAAYDEVVARDVDNQRLRALYGEDITGVGTVNVSVNAERSRLNTTRPVPASGLRDWASDKLTKLARSQLALRDEDPIAFFVGIHKRVVDGVPHAHHEAVADLAVAIATCRKTGHERIAMKKDAMTLVAKLPAKSGSLSARPDCVLCGEMVLAKCDHCRNHAVQFNYAEELCCARCGGGTFTCYQGHELPAATLTNTLTFEPADELLGWISLMLVQMRLEVYERTGEQFWVRGTQLLYQQRPLLPDGTYTVLMVDIENSTALGHKKALYAELLATLRDGLMSLAREYRGHFGQDTGDGGFAFFDREKDAVAAARALQALMRSSEHNRLDASIRIGLATGAVETAGRRYTGLAINLSERLQKEALKGSRIALDAKTLFGAKAEAAVLGSVNKLKGFAESTEDYYLLAESPNTANNT